MELEGNPRGKFLLDMADAYNLHGEPRNIFLTRFAYNEDGKFKDNTEIANLHNIGKTTLSTHQGVIYQAFTKNVDFEYDLYLLVIAKLLNNTYLRLFNFYFYTSIQQRPENDNCYGCKFAPNDKRGKQHKLWGWLWSPWDFDR